MRTHRKKVIVAMSGGVDSSVAATLLKQRGYEVVGIFLHFWKEENIKSPLDKGGVGDFENKCCSTEALLKAQRVCRQIGIPLYTLNFSDLFKRRVVDDFIKEYGRGKTPNPCIICNKSVKLGELIVQANKLGYDQVATGHYVKISRSAKGKYSLARPRDKNKDQSYFLYSLNQDQLKHLIFPLAGYTKPQVRALAKKLKLATAQNKDSQEICFIAEKNHNEFLKRHLKLKPGPIVLLPPLPARFALRSNAGGTKGVRGIYVPLTRGVRGVTLSPYKGEPACPIGRGKGEVIGRHQGLPLYTIGQRKGIASGGSGPYYVAKTDYKTNTLYVVQDGHDPRLYNDHLAAKNINWISGKPPKFPFTCQAVIRYRHPAVKCIITPTKYSPLIRGRKRGGVRANEVQVRLAKPQRAITPGQSVVFYQGDQILGGGIIK